MLLTREQTTSGSARSARSAARRTRTRPESWREGLIKVLLPCTANKSLFGPVLLNPKKVALATTSGICTQRTEDGEGRNESIKNGTYLRKLNFRLAQAVARLRISTGLLSYRTRIHFKKYVPFLLDSSPIIWSRNNGPATTKVLSKPVLYLVGNHGRTWSNSGGHNAQAAAPSIRPRRIRVYIVPMLTIGPL